MNIDVNTIIAIIMLIAITLFAYGFPYRSRTQEEENRYNWNMAMLKTWSTKKPVYISYDMQKKGAPDDE